jgi:hypothetical protein
MILGEEGRGFFQELVLHAQFPVLAFEFLQPRPLRHRQGLFFHRVTLPVRVDPITEGAFQ